MREIYKKRTWVSKDGKFKIVEKFHTWGAQPKGSRRRERKQESDVSQENRNRMRKRDRLTRQLLDNFSEGDKYLTLTYKGELPEEEQIKKDYRKIARQLKGIYQRAGAELKYISLIENLKGGGRAHIHMVIPELPGLTGARIERLWGKGFVKVEEYKADIMDARRLAEYFTKSKTVKWSSPVMPSRNLIRREPIEQTMKADTYRENTKPPEGYMELNIEGWSGSWETEDGFSVSRKIYMRIDNQERWKRRDGHDEGRSIGKDRGGGGRGLR